MATINYYLDKLDKKGYAPIFLKINCTGSQTKISIGKKIKPEDFDKSNQQVLSSADNYIEINNYLKYLKIRANNLLNHSYNKTYSIKDFKDLLNEHAVAYKQEHKGSLLKKQNSIFGTPITFVDLFAGAGGFSEGFLQAEVNHNFYDFIAANDINENCELTHLVRYNYQIGLATKFLCQDITEPDFLDNLLKKIGDKRIDVVCGGPPCQSFSLAGKRKKFDKKDDLFFHYLGVIKKLRPKYFVMENVKGILTKENGKIKELILKEINSIIDIQQVPVIHQFLQSLIGTVDESNFIIDCLIKRVELEQVNELKREEKKESYISFVDSKFRQLTPKIVDYKISKTDSRVSTIRHGFNILIRNKQWQKMKMDIIKEKDFCNIDNDFFVNDFSTFLSNISSDKIINKIELAFNKLEVAEVFKNECNDILKALKIYTYSIDETLEYIKGICNKNKIKELNSIINSIRLYKIEKPLVVNASNYGVPQNRERVLFIGCRNDQKFISEIPPTVLPEEKVSVFEALYDLDFVVNNQIAPYYDNIDIEKQFGSRASSMRKLIRKRLLNGKIDNKAGKTYSEWSRKGRLINLYDNISKPFYVKSREGLENGEKYYDLLNNHQTSNQSEKVIKRLQVILNKGSYKLAQNELLKKGLSTDKRNYNLLKPDQPSSTIMTIPDDYIHYNSPRALTVREMARLQSFDDSFVFQGKRSTGGNNRKTEVPQYSLVGNSVPPLLARAVAEEILKNIE